MTLIVENSVTRAIERVPLAELEADPHGIFRAHRSHAPFLQREDGVYLAIRAQEVQSLLSDDRTRQVETELIRLRGVTEGALFDFCNYSMLLSNGETHRARRAPLAKTFAFRMVEGLRPRIRAYAHEIIDRHEANGAMDLLADYAALIPGRTIAFILGLPDDDVPKFTGLVYIVSKILGAAATPDEIPAIEMAAAELIDYVAALIDDRRRNPRGDFLSDYIAAVDQKGELSPMEAIMQIVSVVLAGSDTTRAAMVIQTALLLHHPQQWDGVRADRSLVSKSVLESLRFEPPVASVPRFVRQPIEIDGQVLPANALVNLMTISAMRDEAVYTDPDVFDIFRDQPRWHPVFGGGEHRCLGEALAKIELEEGLEALTARLPDLHADGSLQVKGHAGIRRTGAFSVHWR